MSKRLKEQSIEETLLRMCAAQKLRRVKETHDVFSF